LISSKLRALANISPLSCASNLISSIGSESLIGFDDFAGFAQQLLEIKSTQVRSPVASIMTSQWRPPVQPETTIAGV
jgi:hypothetical protein